MEKVLELKTASDKSLVLQDLSVNKLAFSLTKRGLSIKCKIK